MSAALAQELAHKAAARANDFKGVNVSRQGKALWMGKSWGAVWGMCFKRLSTPP
jgi:hypothetical protein